VPHRRGSFHEDWNDLLTRFAHRRKHEKPREEMLEKARHEAEMTHLHDPHRALFELAHDDD
jgi:hypothetical protein